MKDLIADHELYEYFRIAMPDNTDEEIALSMADFLEQHSPKGFVSDEEKDSIAKWIKDLRAYALKDQTPTIH